MASLRIPGDRQSVTVRLCSKSLKVWQLFVIFYSEDVLSTMESRASIEDDDGSFAVLVLMASNPRSWTWVTLEHRFLDFRCYGQFRCRDVWDKTPYGPLTIPLRQMGVKVSGQTDVIFNWKCTYDPLNYYQLPVATPGKITLILQLFKLIVNLLNVERKNACTEDMVQRFGSLQVDGNENSYFSG